MRRILHPVSDLMECSGEKWTEGGNEKGREKTSDPMKTLNQSSALYQLATKEQLLKRLPSVLAANWWTACCHSPATANELLAA